MHLPRLMPMSLWVQRLREKLTGMEPLVVSKHCYINRLSTKLTERMQCILILALLCVLFGRRSLVF